MITIAPIQVIVLIIVFFAVSRAILRLKDHEISVFQFLFWLAVWCGVLVIALLPGLTQVASNVLGVERGVDVVVYLGVLVLFYLLFRVYVRLENIEQDLTKIVRVLSLERAKKK